jgi:hypothetical protein
VIGQTLAPIVAVVWLTFVIRGLLRVRALTWPAFITAAWALTYWQESLADVTGPRFAYNAGFFDRGDWTSHLPFVRVPGIGLPQPLGMEPFIFVGMFCVFSYGAGRLMAVVRKATGWARWRVAVIGYLAILVVEFTAEMTAMAQGVHGYPQVFGALSIRAGTAHQFPLYENWLLGLMWLLPGLLMFLVRENEPGLRVPVEVVGSGRRGTVTAVLAFAGALNIAFLLYNLIAFVWLPADTFAPMPPWLNP